MAKHNRKETLVSTKEWIKRDLMNSSDRQDAFDSDFKCTHSKYFTAARCDDCQEKYLNAKYPNKIKMNLKKMWRRCRIRGGRLKD